MNSVIPQVRRPDTVPVSSNISIGDALPAAVERIVQVLQPEKIILFGSYAHGFPTPNSDIDLLVILDTDLPPRERYLAVSRLLRPRPFPVDLLVKTPSEIQALLERGDFFIREIIIKGAVLYERS